MQFHRRIERRLSAQRRQQRIPLLALDDPHYHIPGDRLDIGAIRRLWIGPNRRRACRKGSVGTL